MTSPSIPTRTPILKADLVRRSDEAAACFNEGIDLADCEFLPEDPRGVVQSYAQMDVTKSDLSRSYLHDSDYSESIFSEAMMPAVQITNTNMQRCNFFQTKLHGSTLTQTDFAGATFENADLVRTVAEECHFVGANLDDVNWREGKLLASTANFATFRHSNLRKLMARDSQFVGSIFTGADLTDVNFTDASLAHANLTGARLLGTIFEGTDLTGTNLRGVLFGPDTLAGEYHLKDANLTMTRQCVWLFCKRCPDPQLIRSYIELLRIDTRKEMEERQEQGQFFKDFFTALELDYPLSLRLSDPARASTPEGRAFLQQRIEHPESQPEWIVRLFLNGMVPILFSPKNSQTKQWKPDPEFNPLPIRHLLRDWLEEWFTVAI